MVERIPDEIIESLKHEFIGKRIQVKGIIGKCTFFGYNRFIPSFGIQATIDNMPVTNINISEEIVILPDLIEDNKFKK